MGERRRGREKEKSKDSKKQTAKAETSDLLLEHWGICEGFKVADGVRVSTSESLKEKIPGIFHFEAGDR